MINYDKSTRYNHKSTTAKYDAVKSMKVSRTQIKYNHIRLMAANNYLSTLFLKGKLSLYLQLYAQLSWWKVAKTSNHTNQ